MTRPKGQINSTYYHYLIVFHNKGYKYYRTNIDLKNDIDCSYKTIQNFLKKPNYISRKFKDIKNIKKVLVEIRDLPHENL